jgi:predicted dehydrogenase
MSLHPSRRNVLKTVGAMSLAPALLPSLVRAASANGMLNHVSIGVGGMMGYNDFRNFVDHPKVRHAAIVDVDANFLAKAAADRPDAAKYSDWREMFAKEGDKIDSVNCTIPDHMHASVTMTALRAKKHIYCQKPMCHDVSEVRAITAAAKASGVRTQLGTQAGSTVGSRMAVAMIQSGTIGKIKRVVIRGNRPGIEFIRLAGPRPEKGETPPANFNWDLWLGTAPTRNFNAGIYHPSVWRCWQDFGTGWTGDIGCHLFHAIFRSLELTAPTTISAKTQQSWMDDAKRKADNWPQSNYVSWMYPATKYTTGECQVEWYDGEFLPGEDIYSLIDAGDEKLSKEELRNRYHFESALFVGEEGTLMLPNGGGPQLFPVKKFREMKRPSAPSGHHYHDFVDATFSGTTTESDFAFSGPMSESVLLSTVAIRTPGEKLAWDPAALKITNNASADKLLRRSYRAGWKIEGLGS